MTGIEPDSDIVGDANEDMLEHKLSRDDSSSISELELESLLSRDDVRAW